MARLRPAEAWQLRKHLGIHDAEKAEEALELQVGHGVQSKTPPSVMGCIWGNPRAWVGAAGGWLARCCRRLVNPG